MLRSMPARAIPKLPTIGDTIAGKYDVVRIIAEGGMGIVYEVLHKRIEERFALKVLSPNAEHNPESRARFELEGRIASRIKSPNVARVFDVDTLPSGLPYMVMELLDGHDLHREVSEKKMLSVETAVDIASQAASGVAEAHALGVVHRDLKPSNLFLCTVAGSERRLVKVLDFGISRVLNSGGRRITDDFHTLGTAQYMSPEQIQAGGEVDARSDVWALGIVLYEMLLGTPPFNGSVTDVIVQVATAVIIEPHELRPDVPRGLNDVIMRALERDPARRFQSMGELVNALAPWAPAAGIDELVRSMPPPAPMTMPPLPPRRSSGVVAASAALSLLGLGLVVFGLVRERAGDESGPASESSSPGASFAAARPEESAPSSSVATPPATTADDAASAATDGQDARPQRPTRVRRKPSARPPRTAPTTDETPAPAPPPPTADRPAETNPRRL